LNDSIIGIHKTKTVTKLLIALSILLIPTATIAEARNTRHLDTPRGPTHGGIFDVRDETGKLIDNLTYTVERVIDGDTLKLINGEEVQLIGIQAPEDEKMGQEATEFVNKMYNYEDSNKAGLVGRKVKLDFDVQEKDKYGRLLAYVYLSVCYGQCLYQAITNLEYSGLDDGSYVFLNATMVKAGYAQPMTVAPNVKYAELFKELYQDAREQERGLWAKEPYLEPIDCTMDVKECSDGSFVGRVPPNCEFKDCPQYYKYMMMVE